jgi:hypothetical protein
MNRWPWKWIVILALLLIALIAGGIWAYKEHQKDPYSFQETTRFGIRYQQYSQKSAELTDVQRNIKITLPKSDSVTDGTMWTTHNSGCEVRTTDGAWINAVPVENVQLQDGDLYPAGTQFFISCKGEARIWWEREIPAPVATPLPEPTTESNP